MNTPNRDVYTSAALVGLAAFQAHAQAQMDLWPAQDADGVKPRHANSLDRPIHGQ